MGCGETVACARELRRAASRLLYGGNNDPPEVTVWSKTDSNASTLHSAAGQNAG